MKLTLSKPSTGILFALLVKVLLICYLVAQVRNEPGIADKFSGDFVIKTADYGYFLQPVENYFKDNSRLIWYNDQNTAFAGRMPGYWFPYFLLRLVFGSAIALNLLILLQILLSAAAVYYLARAALLITKNIKVFYFIFFLYLLLPYAVSFDLFTQSESFAISASALHLYFLVAYFYNGKKRSDLFWSGFFLAWLIFLRPFMGLAIVYVPLLLLIYGFGQRQKFTKVFGTAFIFCAAFLIFEGAWITRNYVQLKKIIPLEADLEESYGKTYALPWIKIRQMIVSFGENAEYFEHGTMAEWFKSDSTTAVSRNYKFNEKIFDQVNFTKDSLVLLKQRFHQYMAGFPEKEKEKALYDYCVNAAERYRQQYTDAHSFQVHAKNPLLRFKKFIFNSGSSYLILPPFEQMNFHQKTLKLLASAMYYLILVLSFCGLLMLLIRRKMHIVHWIILVHVSVLIALIVLFIDIQENRYLMPVFPGLVLLCYVPAQRFLERKNKKRIPAEQQ